MERKTPITKYYVITTIDSCEYICIPIKDQENKITEYKIINGKTSTRKTTIKNSKIKEIISLSEYMKRLSEKLLKIPEIQKNEQVIKFLKKMYELNSTLDEKIEKTIYLNQENKKQCK